MEALLSHIPKLQNLAALGPVLANPHGLFAVLAAIVFILYGLSVGKTKAMVSLLSVYVAYMLTALFPFMPWLTKLIPLPANSPILPVALFLTLYLATFLALSHSMARHRLTLGEISLTKVVLISIVQLGLISSITLSLLPADFGERAFGPAYPYLAGQRVLWAWAAASLLIMPFMKGHSRVE